MPIETQHTFYAKGYSPAEYLVELVAMGEFPETSIDRQDIIDAERTGIKHRLLQQVQRFPYTHTTSECLTAGKVNERLRHSPPPYVCMTNEVSQEGWGTTRGERLRKKDKKPPLLRKKSYSCSICPHYLAPLPDIRRHTMRSVLMW